MKSSKLVLIVLFILVGSVASFANAGLLSDITDYLGITHTADKVNLDKINITDSGYAWNNVQKLGNEANFKTIVTNSSDKKTSFCWVLKDGITKTSVDTTAKIFLNEKGIPILDDKSKQITITYASAKCNDNGTMKDGYQLSLTTAKQVNIEDSIRLGDDIWKYEKIKKVKFSPSNQIEIFSNLYKNMNGSWSNTINNVFINYTNQKWKFGAIDNSNSGWEQYKYIISSKTRIISPTGKNTNVQIGNYNLALADICNKVVNNKSANCQFTSYTKDGYNYLEILFYSDELIDPEYSLIIDGEAHWKMNDNSASTDIVDSLNGHTCTLQTSNSDALTVTGKINSALFNQFGLSCSGTYFTSCGGGYIGDTCFNGNYNGGYCDSWDYGTQYDCESNSGGACGMSGDYNDCYPLYGDCSGYSGNSGACGNIGCAFASAHDCSSYGDTSSCNAQYGCSAVVDGDCTVLDEGTCNSYSGQCSWGGGTTDYAVCDASTVWNTAPFTISFWTKGTGHTGHWLGINEVGADDWRIEGADYPYFVTDDIVTAQATTNFNDGNWHMATATMNESGFIEWYTDAKRESTYQATAVDGSSDTMEFWKVGGDGAMPMTLDDVRFFKGVLSLSQIQQIYLNGAGTENEFYFNSTAFDITLNSTITAEHYSFIDFENSLKGWWRGDGNALDSINGNTGTWVGTESYTSSLYNSSFNFDGASKINLGNVNALNVKRDYTLAMWINASDLSGDYRALFDHSSFILMYASATGGCTGGKPMAYLVTTTSSYILCGDVLNTGQVYHLAETYDGKMFSFYIDGVLVGNMSASGDFSYNTGAVQTRLGTDGSHYFNGTIDEVLFFDRALSADEILALNASSSLYMKEFIAPSYIGTTSVSTPLLHYALNDNSASTDVIDSSGNSYTGTSTVNTDTIDIAGKINNALDFNGNTIDTGSNFSQLSPGNFTVSTWFKSDSTGSVNGVFSNGGTGYHTMYFTSYHASFGTMYYAWFDSDLIEQNFQGTVVTNDVWHHVAISKVGTLLSLYYDGKLIQQKTTTATLATPTATLKLGTDGYSNSFDGTIDDFRLYDYGLSAGAIANIYNRNRGSENETFGTYEYQINGYAVDTSANLYTNLSSTNYSIEGATKNITLILQAGAPPADTTKPLIQFVNPTNASGITSQSIRINVTATDETLLSNITINLFNSTGLYNSSLSTSSPFYLSFNNLVDGLYFYNATAVDSSSNSNDTETRNITIDNTNPSAILNLPENATYHSTDQNLSVNISEIISPSAGFSGNANYTINSLTSFKWVNNTHNITLYDNTLKVMFNFDNISSLGNTVSKAVGVDRYATNATITNAIWNISNGKYKDAITFDGNGDYLALPTGNNYNLSHELTISFWIKPQQQAGSYDVVYWNSQLWLLYAGDRKMIIEQGGTPGWSLLTMNTAMTQNAWNYITVTKNASDYVVMYLNGNSDKTGTLDITGNAVYSHNIGTYNAQSSTNYCFNGTIDEFRVYNKTLDSQEVKELYASNLAKLSPTSWNFQAPSSLFQYPCYINGTQSEVCDYVIPQVAGSGISSVKLYINNVLTDTWTAVGNIVSTSVGFLKSLADGIYSWFYIVEDNAGNINQTDNRTFTIDKTNPAIVISSPTSNQKFITTSITASFTATDTNRDSCFYSFNGASNTSNSCTSNISLTAIQGNNNLLIYSNDSAGNSNYSSVSFFVDSIYPIIDWGIGTLANNSLVSQNNIYMNTSWTENNFNSITFWRDGISAGYSFPQYDYNSTGLLDGLHTYYVVICDTLGNCNQTSTRTITLDTMNPTINFASPTPISGTTTTIKNIQINITSTDIHLANITLRLYNQSSLLFINVSTSPFNITFSNLADGVYYFNATAIDTIGNINNTETRNVTINTVVQGGGSSGAGGGGSNVVTRLNINAYLCNLTYDYSNPKDYTKIFGLMDIAKENNNSFQWDKFREYIDNWQFYCSDLVNKSLDENKVCTKAFYFIIENENESIKDISKPLKELEPLKVSDSLFKHYISNYEEICYLITGLSLPKTYVNQTLISRLPHPEDCSKDLGNSLFDFAMPIPKIFLTSLSCDKINKLRWIVSIDSDNFIEGIRVWAIFLSLGIFTLLVVISIRKSNKKLHRRFENFSEFKQLGIN